MPLRFWLGIFLLAHALHAASWVQTQGPGGGAVYSLTSMGSSIFAATENGVFESQNGGAWKTANSGFPKLPPGSRGEASFSMLGQAFGHQGLFPVYALATGEGYGMAATKAGLFRRASSAKSWSRVSETPSFRILYAGGGHWFAAGEKQLLRSADHGKTWKPLRDSLIPAPAEILAVAGAKVFAGNSKGGIWRSDDFGKTWSKLETGLSKPISVLAAQGRTLFAGCSGSGIFRSEDFGQSWTRMDSLSSETYNRREQSVRALSVSENVLFAAISGLSSPSLKISRDGGNTWIPSSLAWKETDDEVLAFAAFGPTLYLGTRNEGVLQSRDGGKSWESFSAGLANAGLSALCATEDAVFAATVSGGLFRSRDLGNSWTLVEDYPRPLRVLYQGQGALYSGTIYQMFRSRDGESWDEIGKALNIGTMVNSFASIGARLFVAVQSWGIYRSADGGDTWTEANNGLENRETFCVASAGEALFAGTPWGVFRSLDHGESWTFMKNKSLGKSRFQSAGYGQMVKCLAGSGNAIYVGTYGMGVFRSQDYGQSWDPVDSGLVNPTILCLVAQGQNLYAGTGSGAFALSASGEVWTPLGKGLEDEAVPALAAQGNRIFAGTLDRGVFCLGCPKPE